MNKTDNPKINIDKIMSSIREEVRQQKDKAYQRSTGREETLFSPTQPLLIPAITSTAHSMPHKKSYLLNDFLGRHDSDFIYNAYFSILGRAPDPGSKLYLARLRNGMLTKVDIMGRLRYSREGRNKKIPVKGLLLPFMRQTFFKIPVLGWGLRIITGVLNFPVILKNIQVMENAAFTQIHLVKEESEKRFLHITKLQEEICQAQSIQKKKIKELAALQEETRQAQSIQKRELKEALAELSKQIKGHKLTTLDTQRRVQLLLEEARKRLPEPISTVQIKEMAKEEDHLFDAMYVEFENKFRGTRKEIKERIKGYLPYLKDALKSTDNAPVLDVGCGRGEWLELLKENNIKAQGLDLNRIMIAQCKKLGLDVMEADLIEYLRNLKNNTLSVITGFHIIEHLPFKKLISLFDESLRVLKPGGLVIFETPNPENILVGAHYFYIDPTHINPLVPATMDYIAEQRGFNKIEIKRLHKYSDNYQITDEDSFKKKHIYNEMDFAVIAYKSYEL